MIKLIISYLNISFKKLTVWLQLHPKLIASDYITTGRPLGRTKAVHSCMTPWGAKSGACEAWFPNPSSLSSLTDFNRKGFREGQLICCQYFSGLLHWQEDSHTIVRHCKQSWFMKPHTLEVCKGFERSHEPFFIDAVRSVKKIVRNHTKASAGIVITWNWQVTLDISGSPNENQWGSQK